MSRTSSKLMKHKDEKLDRMSDPNNERININIGKVTINSAQTTTISNHMTHDTCQQEKEKPGKEVKKYIKIKKKLKQSSTFGFEIPNATSTSESTSTTQQEINNLHLMEEPKSMMKSLQITHIDKVKACQIFYIYQPVKQLQFLIIL